MRKYLYILLILVSCNLVLNSQVAVVVNTENPTDTLSIDYLLDIYTLNKKSWANGESIVVVDLKGELSSKKEFLDNLELNSRTLTKIRLKKLFTGKAKPPKSLNSDSEIIEYVASNPGSVGYVDTRNLPKNSNVKVVAVFDS